MRLRSRLGAGVVLTFVLMLGIAASTAARRTNTATIGANPVSLQTQAFARADVQTLQERLNRLEAKMDKPPKDLWDKVTALSGLISGILSAASAVAIAFFTFWAANIYDRDRKAAEARRQDRTLDISFSQAVAALIPHLGSTEADVRKAAFVAMSTLGDPGLAAKFAAAVGGAGANDAILEIACASKAGADAAQSALFRSFGLQFRRVVLLYPSGNADDPISTGLILDDGLVATSNAVLQTLRDGKGVSVANVHGLRSDAAPVRDFAANETPTVALLRPGIILSYPEDPHDPHGKLIGAAGNASPGETVLILTLTRTLSPLIVVGHITAIGVSAALPPHAAGSPIFNQSGEILGLIGFYREHAKNYSITDFDQVTAHAQGRGLTIKRLS